MTMDWRSAVLVYLAVGMVILLVVYAHHRLTRTPKSDWVKAALAAVDPQRQTLRYRILNDMVAPALAAAFIWAVWPIALAMAAKWKRDEQKQEVKMQREREERENRPAVEPGELIECLWIEEIESRETVRDPLNAAPAVPFGHLGVGWMSFRSKLRPQDEIWSFKATRQGDWGSEIRTSGYAAVRDGVIVAHFVSRRQTSRE